MRFSALPVAALLACGAPLAHADTVLHILHTNDLHSRLEPVNKYNSTCSPEDDAAGECFGGAARVKAKIDALRAELDGEKVLVLDAGDQFQGSLMYSAYKGEAAARLMEAIGYDAMAVGNHEFDDGPAVLAKFTDAVSFPVISGNLDLTGEPELAEKVTNHAVIDLDGLKIGLVSALATDTAETSSPGPGVVFENEIEALTADVAALEAEGVTHVIALTHVGLVKDLAIAESVPGLDAVVGGHSHTLLSNTAENAAGPYPTMVGDVPVVQAMAYSQYIGHLTLTFDDAGKLVGATGDTIRLDASVSPDAGVAETVASLAAPLEEIKAEIVGDAAEVINGERDSCRSEECAMGNLVADAMLASVADQGVTIAIQNGGGLRASIDAGEVTMGEVLTVLPFQNTIATFEASGEMLLAALENGVSQVEEGAGRFPQVAGMRFTWDPAAEPGSRIVSVETAEGDGFVPLDPEKTYLVVSHDYLRNGGDGYAMFKEATNAYDYGPSLEDTVAEYISGLGAPYTPYTDGRIATK